MCPQSQSPLIHQGRSVTAPCPITPPPGALSHVRRVRATPQPSRTPPQGPFPVPLPQPCPPTPKSLPSRPLQYQGHPSGRTLRLTLASLSRHAGPSSDPSQPLPLRDPTGSDTRGPFKAAPQPSLTGSPGGQSECECPARRQGQYCSGTTPRGRAPTGASALIGRAPQEGRAEPRPGAEGAAAPAPLSHYRRRCRWCHRPHPPPPPARPRPAGQRRNPPRCPAPCC